LYFILFLKGISPYCPISRPNRIPSVLVSRKYILNLNHVLLNPVKYIHTRLIATAHLKIPSPSILEIDERYNWPNATNHLSLSLRGTRYEQSQASDGRNCPSCCTHPRPTNLNLRVTTASSELFVAHGVRCAQNVRVDGYRRRHRVVRDGRPEPGR